MDNESLLAGRLTELENTAYQRNITKASDFLGLAEQSIYNNLKLKGEIKGGLLWGGYSEAERVIAVWPASYSSESCREDFVACVKISPLNAKFSEELSHRDYLGALLNLGMERSLLGDIVKEDGNAYVYCTSEIAPFICQNLTRVKHTSVMAVSVPAGEFTARPKTENLRVNVASERIDVLIAAVYKLSRSEALALIDSEKVFADGFAVHSAAHKLNSGCKISVRGYGRFIYGGIDGQSRKGRLYANIEQYI